MLYSPDLFPLGQLSDDGVVLVGHEGMCFVVGGTNKASDLYLRTEEGMQNSAKLAGLWFHRLMQRAELLEQYGTRFAQVVIPEKQSVYPHLYPSPIETPTPLYSALDALSAFPWYVRVLPTFLQRSAEQPVFRSADSHLTTFGAGVIAGLIAENLGWHMPAMPLADPTPRHCDLMFRIGRFEIQEICLEALQWGDISTPVALETFMPEEGHIGQRIVYQCDNAPNRARVVCFGNSFSEKGHVSSNLTWWLSRMCTELHFVWGPDVDMDYIDKVNPDIVIGQTIERFLRMVPAS